MWATISALFASVGLFLLVFLGGVLATVTGILEEYEPPKLSAAQLTGVWRGEEGAVLRLGTGGRADLTALPADRRRARRTRTRTRTRARSRELRVINRTD